eukprot:SAG31_NODE_22948_length_514_cov_1.291566_2_plen_28_part_01
MRGHSRQVCACSAWLRAAATLLEPLPEH